MEAGRACRFAQARLQAGLPAPCRPLQTRLNLSQHPWEGRQGEGEAGEERQVFPTPPSLRAGGVGEGRPRPPEAAVRSRQGGQTWVRCKNRAAAATAHGFTQQQQLSLPMWLKPKAERPLRWGPDALQSQTSGQPMQSCNWQWSRLYSSPPNYLLLNSAQPDQLRLARVAFRRDNHMLRDHKSTRNGHPQKKGLQKYKYSISCN